MLSKEKSGVDVYETNLGVHCITSYQSRLQLTRLAQ